ncbi:MAG: DUF1684 domain-containing protein [Holophagales bacterium]|nr:DUF1684 domain-containing protein [Holophagales bacterium]MYF06083.1 DUF1684 domain-containing protein [Holophagales bacterium]MYJ27127.1 DUF1684 domain-containing protein [Holophagales bacterium]
METHRIIRSASVVAAIFTLTATTQSSAQTSYEHALAEWRSQRVATLKGPEGWLNLAGLYWLEEGPNSFGAAADNDLVAPEDSAPPKLGVFLVKDGTVTFKTEPGVDVILGESRVTEILLADDQEKEATLLTSGPLAWTVIRRMDRLGVRLRDYDHPAVAAFASIQFYPADPSWRLEARFEPYPEPRTIRVPTVVEGLGWEPTVPGTLEFEAQGESLSLEAYRSDDGFMIVFADATTGDTTYPAGRYLAAALPGPEGTTILDFNRAYNPPCVFTEFATCPLATPRNRLPVAVHAGEKYTQEP